MKKIAFSVIILMLFIVGCSKNESDPSFESKIVGNWQAVNESYQQIAPEWGLVYEASIKLYADHTFAENVPVGSNSAFKLGTWELKNKNTSIVFYSKINDSGTIYKDTTEFSISIDATGKLILQNDQNLIRHKRLE